MSSKEKNSAQQQTKQAEMSSSEEPLDEKVKLLKEARSEMNKGDSQQAQLTEKGVLEPKQKKELLKKVKADPRAIFDNSSELSAKLVQLALADQDFKTRVAQKLSSKILE